MFTQKKKIKRYIGDLFHSPVYGDGIVTKITETRYYIEYMCNGRIVEYSLEGKDLNPRLLDPLHYMGNAQDMCPYGNDKQPPCMFDSPAKPLSCFYGSNKQFNMDHCEFNPTKNTQRCSFCGKSIDGVFHISTKRKDHIICSECIQRSVREINKRTEIVF